MGKKSRTKGAGGELEFRTIVNKKFGVKYERTPLSGGLDIKGDIRRAYGSRASIADEFHWEIKRVEKINIHECLTQSINDCRPGKIPVVAHRRNCDYWKITIQADDFLNLILELEELRGKPE